MKSEGLGFFSILTLILITLKLLGYITWSWVWVLFFVWFPFALLLVFFIVALLIIAISETAKKIK